MNVKHATITDLIQCYLLFLSKINYKQRLPYIVDRLIKTPIILMYSLQIIKLEPRDLFSDFQRHKI